MIDEEIDTELKSYAYNDVQDFACIIKDSEPISWAEIESNVFLHRNRKTEKTDEIMVCTCMPPINGSLGCGDQCLNKMFNIECARDTCPCGDRCSNQQFQKHKYAKLKLSSCGKKGAVLQLLENVSKGQFLIEYVGEVPDQTTYEARQRSYASMGHKHFYFMMLDGGEVIDASTKGNLSRFISHNCDPNCRSEKWMVNGELCVGLFAIRDIQKGEEVTFNYQYMPVSGAAIKKCFCGAANCRGYIGGNSSDGGAMIHVDSDENPKPVMILPKLEKDTSCRFSSDAHPLGPLTQTITERNNQTSISTRQIERIEKILKNVSDAVEKILKKVSDGRGGIGNHKHATVYLKLLSVITAEGDNLRGIQRARVLFFMLDALLKTKSHSVLVYIISKNGLQMLHNIMKQYLSDFMRTPIIRKLLKVLEFLAVQGILTQERIRSCPYAGTESFEKSMTALTRHDDMQVRNIARKLQDELRLHSDENSVRKVRPSQQHATFTCSTNERRIHEPESQWVQPSDVTTKYPPSLAKGTEADLKFHKPTFSNADDEAFQPQRHGYDMFGRFWPPWPQEENGPLKERRQNNSQEKKWWLKDERLREENSRHEEEKWRKRLRGEESKCLKRPRENEILLQEENWRKRPQNMERPYEDNWRRESPEENWRKRLPQEKRPRAEHKWLKRPQGEERSREDHHRRRQEKDQKWLKRLRGDERSREGQTLQKRLRFEDMPPQEEKENWWRSPQEMERSREDDQRKNQLEKENWRKCTLEKKLQWEDREHWRRNGHGR